MTVIDDGRAVLAEPSYAREAVSPGIVHFGFGAFHRAHQAAYLDRLMNTGEALDWGIVGVNVLPRDAHMHEVMLAQGCRYTQVLKHPDGRLEARTIGSVVEHLHAPDDPAAVVAWLADPRIRIVSLTITEGGYERDPATGEFRPGSAEVLADLTAGDGADAGSNAAPRSVFGLLVAGLRARRTAGVAPFTVLSCDNVQGNGEIARSSLVAFAARLDPELAAWIDATVGFPSTMVDRITPITTDEDRELVRTRFGVDDAWPVVAEPFAQWVIEDVFPLGRPPLERVGVQFVADVAPYETMKLRLLNASHQVLAHPSVLLGHERVDEAMADPLVRGLVRAYFDEALPTLPAVPGIDLTEYCDTLVERYSNPWVRDTVGRLAMDAENRLAVFVLPVLRDLRAQDRPFPVIAAVLAAWLEGALPRSVVDTGALEEAVRGQALLGEFADDAVVVGELAGCWRRVREAGIRSLLGGATDPAAGAASEA